MSRPFVHPQSNAGLAAAQPFAAADMAPTPSPVEKLRVLIPIDATERSRWPIRHALAQHSDGAALEVHLLHVAEPVVDWQVLRFRTQAEIARFQAQRAGFLLEDAARPLRAAEIEVVTHFRVGDISAEIVDASEQLGCRQILLPAPCPGWLRLFSRDVVRAVMEKSRSAKVRTVDPASALRE